MRLKKHLLTALHFGNIFFCAIVYTQVVFTEACILHSRYSCNLGNLLVVRLHSEIPISSENFRGFAFVFRETLEAPNPESKTFF